MLDYTHLIVLTGVAIIGMTTGALGCLAFLRQQSLLGDAISHASLPGIVLMFMLTSSKNPLLLLLGGSITGAVGAAFVSFICHATRLKKDASLGIVLATFFGFGLVLITHMQKFPIAAQGMLNKFLFGNVATLLQEELIFITGISLLLLTVLYLCERMCMITIFDPHCAYTQAIPVTLLQTLMTSLHIIAIVMGLQTVGVILMSSMFIAPAAAARQWTVRTKPMIIIAMILGALASTVGVLITSYAQHIPNGPVIVIIMSALVFGSLLCSKRR